MPTDLTLTTCGLPTPGGPTCRERTFEWFFVGATLTIPKYQCGQTDFCARDHEQRAWLDAHGAQWIHGVWDCVWEWNTPTARDEFMAALAPLDPLADAVARAVGKLARPKGVGRAKAARALLALDRPNLAAAVPTLERVMRAADPELRVLAAALLYQWHRRTEAARLPALFRDEDPVVREAVLQQFDAGDPTAKDRMPYVLERVADDVQAVRHQALRTLEAAAIRGLITGRRVLELRADLGPLADADGLDRTDALATAADKITRSPSAPTMEAFYAALCAVESLRTRKAPGSDAEVADAVARACGLWDRLLLDAPEEVRLYNTRIDVVLGDRASMRPQDAELVRRIERSRSPRRAFDAAAIFWVFQHTAPRGLPAELVGREAAKVRADESRGGASEHDDENIRLFLRHLD